jgi:hypothetical protein
VNGDKDGNPRSLARGVASPALVDVLLAYAVAMAVGVAVFTSSVDRQPRSWPAYLFALDFGLILLHSGVGARCWS